MNILPPPDILDAEPEKLYTIGLDDKEPNAAPQSEADVLQRKELGEKLSRIVENSNEALIIALNGGWGSGKTWFLKRWVGAHGLENGGKALTVYISAFNHDYLEDPLPSIILAIDERITEAEKQEAEKFNSEYEGRNIAEKYDGLKRDLKKVKKWAFKFARPITEITVRAGVAWATHGVSEKYREEIKAAGGTIAQAADAYWRKQDAKQNSIEGFRKSLAEFAENQPLVIVIDELDRAKPDYALSVLETIKHFFNVPHVKFILGVNLPALGKMVRCRYGLSQADSLKYLERFIHFTLELPNKIQTNQGAESNAAAYCAWALENMSIDKKLAALFLDHIEAISQNNSISLRDTQRLLSKFLLILPTISEHEASANPPIVIETLLALLSSKLLRPEVYNKLINRKATTDDILLYYGNTRKVQELESCYKRWLRDQNRKKLLPADYGDSSESAFTFLQYNLEGKLNKYTPSRPSNSTYTTFMWIHDIPQLQLVPPLYDMYTHLERAQSYLDLFNLKLPTEAEVAPAPTADKKADGADAAPDK